jgi:hypothetical protein
MEATIEWPEGQLSTFEADGLTYTVDEWGEIVAVERPGFHVNDSSSAEWLLEKLQEQDAQIVALNARKAAICENLDTQIKQAQNRRNGLLFKYEGELVEFARQNLPEKKRTWISPFGSVKFTTQPARLKVADPDRALQFAKEHNPEAIKVTEEFQISKLGADPKADLTNDAEFRQKWGFDLTPETETHKVETGVKA